MAASPPTRRSTGESIKPIRSRQTTDHMSDAQLSNHPRDTVENFIAVYRLPFEVVRSWLEEKFPKAQWPNLTFEKKLSVQEDRYVVELPRLLTQSERDEILSKREPELDTCNREQSDEEDY